MFKKAIKKIYLLAILVLVVGGVFLIPQGQDKSKAEDTKVEETIPESNIESENGLWSGNFDNVSEYSIGTTTLYGQTVKTINNASDLAFFAYQVNNGVSGYVDGTFALTTNIDLAGQLWTPIGTSAKPFKGTFYGEGYTISNISINDYSTMDGQTPGLFGHLNGAKICDLTLGGWHEMEQGSTSGGALAGSISGGTYIINCYDTCTKVSDSGASYNTIGSSTSSDYIYKGGYRERDNFKYTSKENIDSTISLRSGTANYGYVGYYTLSNAAFMIGDQQWHTPNKLKVLLNSSFAVRNSDVAAIFKGTLPTLRVNATNSNVYVLREGYQASINAFASSDCSNGLVKAITTSAKNISVVLNHSYGSRSATYTFGYDQSFASYFSQNPYVKNRAGYSFAGIYKEAGLTNAMDASTCFSATTPNTATFTKYKSCFPVENSTYYFKWTANSGQSFKVNFAIASNEGGNFNASALTSAVKTYTSEYTNQTSGEKTFTVVLNAGYQIANLAKSTDSVTVSSSKANKTGGLYVNFNNSTGTGSNYNYASDRNNDSYAPVAISGTLSSGTVASGATYTITLENLCGTGGDVWIVLERQWVKIDFSIVKDTSSIDYEWSILSDTLVTKFDGSEDLLVRRGEKPNVKIAVKATSSTAYILSYIPGSDLIVSADSDNCETVSYDNGVTNYYKSFAFLLNSTASSVIERDSSLTIYLGPLKTRISVELVNMNGTPLTSTQYAGMSVKINGSSAVQNTTSLDVGISTNEVFVVNSNGAYEANYVTVNGTNIGEFAYASNNNNIRNLTTSGRLVNAYTSGTTGVNYAIKIYCSLRKYNISFEFYFNGSKVAVTDGKIGASGRELIKSITGDMTSKDATTTYAGTFTLTDIGLGALYFDSVTVDNKVGASTVTEAQTGYTLSTVSNSISVGSNGVCNYNINLGTYNSVVKVNFKYKTFNLRVNSLHVAGAENVVAVGENSLSQLEKALNFTYTDADGLKISGNLGSISIHTQYYLIGWYLQNGKVVDKAGFQTFFSNPTFVDEIAKSGKSNSTTSFTSTIVSAEVGVRTVNVYYNAGTAGSGRLYKSDKTTLASGNVLAGTVTYGQALTLNNNVFYNLGYTFNRYVAPYGSITGTTFKLEGGAGANSWSYLFSSSTDTMLAWSTLLTTDTRNVVLTAEWTKIAYHVNVDNGYNTTTVSIGDSIYYTTDDSKKNGQAIYFIGSTTQTNGSILNGYVVTGYTITDKTTLTKTGAGASNKFTLTPDNFLSFIADNHRFSANTTQTAIKILTTRDQAQYVIFLDNSSKGYYSYTWTEAKDSGNYGQISGGQISINVTFGSPVSALTSAISSGALTVTRTGYTLAGWAVSSSGEQSAVFDPTKAYSEASDFHIVPTWKLVSNTTASSIGFNSDVGNTRTFYLEKSHDILTGNAKVGGTVQNLASTFANGENVTAYGFIVTHPNKTTTTYANKTTFNYDVLTVAGNYTIEFYVTMTDALNKLSAYPAESYTVKQSTTFTIAKNTLYFFNNNLHTIYNGTSEFVEGEENDFGSFLYAKDWNGADLTAGKQKIGDVEGWFGSFTVTGDFNAGSNKNLKMTLKNESGKFGNRVLSDVFTNVSNENGVYSVTLSNLTINKAKFAITFPEGSAYYVAGVQALVYDNSQNYTFSVGSVTFAYTYDKILLPYGATAGTYKGSKDHATDSTTFVLQALAITNHTSDRDTNFEWIITEESVFNLLDSSSALQLSYSSRYLTASSGTLAGSFASSYNSATDNMTIANIKVDGSTITLPSGDQYSVFYDNKIILSYAGNGTANLVVLVNKSILSTYEISYQIETNVSTARKTTLKPLAWISSTETVASLTDDFDTFNSSYTKNEKLSYSMANSSFYAVLTDVVKVNIDYNGGQNSGKTSETIYVSASSPATITNPTHPYNSNKGFTFGGYLLATGTKLTVQNATGAQQFKTTTGGKTETVKAKWTFASIDGVLVKSKHEFYASKNALDLALTDIATINLPDHVTSNSYSLKKGTTTYNINASKKFVIANDQGYLTASMSGTYTLEISLTYSDGVTSAQTKNLTLSFEIEIAKNIIEFMHDGSHLTYSNASQEANVNLGYYLNETKVKDVKLSALSVANNTLSEYNIYVSVVNASGVASAMKNAGTYTITFTVDSNLTDIYQIASSKNTVNVTIDKYTIRLSTYSETISSQLTKIFGLADPNPIKANLTISENGNDSVSVCFERSNKSEAIGKYPVSCLGIYGEDDAKNYTVDATGSNFNFEIVVPSGNLKVEFESKITYVYNGYALTNLTGSYNSASGKYSLTGTAGSQTYSANFNIYYEAGANKIQIPADQKEAYAQMIEFASSTQAKVGTYSITASLEESSKDVWSGVEITNAENAKIVVTKRDLTVSAITKVFDQTKGIFFNSVNQTNNTCEITLSNLVDYGTSVDQVELTGTIASELVGEQTIKSLALTSTGVSSNYNLVYATTLKVKVVASTSAVSGAIDGSNSVEYGKISEGSDIGVINGLISIKYNNGAIKTDYISVSAYEVVSAEYSTGKYLNAGSYTVKFTLSSKNYTFGNSRVENLSNVYTKTESLTIVVNTKAITITNSTSTITKVYDGNADVLSAFLSQNVNGEFYASSGLLEGDIITITDAEYNDKTIGNGKPLKNIVASGQDKDNYTITYSLKGNITSVNLVFNKNGASINFVDGVKEFGNTASIKTVYSGSLDTLISSITNSSNFLTRVGYTQTGFAYGGKNIASMTTAEKEDLLQDAVDAGATGITIDAIWQIKEVTLSFTVSNAEIYIDGVKKTSVTVDYYTSFANIEVRSNTGYTFEGYTLSNEGAVGSHAVTTGLHNKNASFQITNLLDNLTISFNITEIEVKIILNFNTPSGFTATTDNSDWKNLTTRTLKYTQLKAQDLPIVYITESKTYDFDFWTLSGSVSSGSNIWSRINGDSLVEDNVSTGYTFVANWTESELTLTLDLDANTSVVVKLGETTLTPSGDTIKYHYNDTLSFAVTSSAWYKWTTFTRTGEVTAITGNTSATKKTTGAFTLETIKEDLTVVLKSTLISVNFATSYATPEGTTISQANGSISGIYTHGSHALLSDLIEKYTPAEGTYDQDKWIYNNNTDVALDSNLENLIVSINGAIPTEDISIALKAHFVGLTYTVYFDKGSEEGASFDEDATAQQVTRPYVYGSTMDNIPVINKAGRQYVYKDASGKTFREGQIFTTSCNSASLTLTLTAQWDYIPYKVEIVLSVNDDKVNSITYEGYSYSGYVETVYNTNVTFVFGLAEGYEINTLASATFISSGDSATTLSAQAGQITVQSVRADTVVTVAIKAKDYKITINKHTYENIDKTEFDVSYDMDISNIFSSTVFTRGGYTLSGLNVGLAKFASYSSGWTFDGEFTDGNIYKHDGDLTLTVVWNYDASAKYIQANTSVASGLYYNGSAQTVATSTFTVTDSQTLAIGTTFANGEKVNEVYYMLDGVKTSCEGDFSLKHKDCLTASVYIVAIIEDTHTGATHQIKSNALTVNIAQSEVNVLNAVLESYYNETSTINNTPNTVLGSVYFHDTTLANNEISIEKVEIIDSSRLYSIGTGYEVKYFFNKTALFNKNNYTGLNEESGYMTLTTENMVSKLYAKIVKTQVTLSFSGQGYYNGQTHAVQSHSSSFPDFASTFKANVSSIITLSSTIGNYTSITDFEVNAVILNSNDQDRTSNFEFVVAGGYQIISNDLAYRIDYGTRYLNMDNISGLEKLASEALRISSFTYSGRTITVGEGNFSFMSPNGKLILTITDNGSDGQYVYLTKGESAIFSFILDESAPTVLSYENWTASSNVSAMVDKLKVLSAEGARSSNISLSADTTYYAVVTDFKAILMSLGDKGGDQGYIYVKKGASADALTPSAWTGFDFNGWQAGATTTLITITGNRVTADQNATIVAGEIVAKWKLLKPTAAANTVTFNAQVDLNAKHTVTIGDILAGGITNRNEAITYSYTVYKAGAQVAYGEEFNLSANTTAEGKYQLEILATFGSSFTKTTLEFDVQVNRLSLDSVVLSETTFTYANKDFIPEITVTFAGAVEGEIALENLLENTDLSYYFTLSGTSEREIRVVGEYTLTLNVNSTVFDTALFDEEFDFERSINVNKAGLVLTQADIPASVAGKLYTEDDPAFIVTKTMFSGANEENVTLTLTRVAGEDCGTYAFNSIVTSNPNYNPSIEEGTVFTISQSNLTLKITIDEKLSKVYSKTQPNFVVEYNTGLGKWTATLEGSVSTLSLTYQKGKDEVALTGALYRHALERINMTAPSAINVGLYDGGDISATGEGGNFADYEFSGQFEITKLGLVISKVEKVFDRNNLIKVTGVEFENLIEGDTVILSGTYSSLLAGENIALADLTISGASAGNYEIANPGFKGKITPAEAGAITFALNDTEFVYGDISKDTAISDLLALSGGNSFDNGGEANDIVNGYITISSFTVENKYLSTSNHIKVGDSVIKVVLTSTNFTGLNPLGYEVAIKVTPLEIDLSAISIAKQFDETTSLPDDLSTSIEGYVKEGDIVSIDLTKGGFDDANIGVDKHVTIVLTGADSANYTVKDNVKGTITAYIITLNVNASTEHADLVTDGAFVADGFTPNVVDSSFILYYPSEIPALDAYNTLTVPTRKGYNALGWKYYDEANDKYITLDPTNLYEVLRSVANDTNNANNEINIFTEWQIQEYSLIVSRGNIDTLTMTATPALSGDEDTGYTIRYYSDLEISAIAKRGYKIQAVNLASGEVLRSNLTDVGTNSGEYTFEKVASDLRIEIITQLIGVTFEIDFNTPLYTERTDSESLQVKFNYTLLSTLTENDLPNLTVTAGTYFLNGFEYNADGDKIGTKTLKEIVDELYAQLVNDVTINLKATWQGESYIIKFNANGGTLDGESQISAIYGSEITNTIPNAVWAGRTHNWMFEETVYTQGDILRSVGVKEGYQWTITFTAIWKNNPYALTVKFNDKLAVYKDGVAITSGDQFSLVFNETIVIFEIQPINGYIFDFEDSLLNGQASRSGDSVEVKDLINNGEITFFSLPDDNTLTLETDKVESVRAYLDDGKDTEVEIKEGKLIVKTESVVKIVFTSTKGWEFDDNSATFTGNGNCVHNLSADNKTITVTWSNFVDDGKLTVKGVASENVVTTGDLNSIFNSLSFNGHAIDLDGDTFIIKTDEMLAISGVLVYGYKDGMASTTCGNVESENNIFSATDRYYHYTGVINGFDENFTVSFENAPREFNFALSVRKGDENYGQITAQTNQTVKFGENLILSQTELLQTYMFEQWLYHSDKELSLEPNVSIKLDDSQRNMLECVAEGETINIFATYTRRVVDIKFTAEGKGKYLLTQEAEGLEILIENNSTSSHEIFMGQNLKIVLQPNDGYEIGEMKIDSVLIDPAFYGYDKVSNIMEIYIENENPIKDVYIKFIPSEATVYVQGVMRVNYVDHYGTTAGGNIYIADNTGLRLGDENYLTGKNGTTLIGGNYSVLTYTDETLYFVIEAKSGFTLSISASEGVVINEYEGDNGHVYSFANVKDGSEINVIYTAKENIINVQFALEGSTDIAHAGIITVDTASGLVSAVPNRGDSLTIGLITGVDLSLNVNALLSYSLIADENGLLKYSIVYDDNETFADSQISAGAVSVSDSVFTGFTNSATFNISDVSLGATIIFYVEPREYSIEFHLFEDISLTMAEKVRYGEEWSTDLLTSEEKATVFANRKGYSFLGYYTMPNGQGKQYIDQYGYVISNWYEDGYTYSNSMYQAESNFDEETDTFTLYAHWSYNKARITLNFAPSDVETVNEVYNIAYFITNINSLNPWISQDDKWYTEVTAGATLQFKAIDFAGYKFKHFVVSFEGKDEVKSSRFDLSKVEIGSYTIKAVYQPTFTLKVFNQNNGLTNGGSVVLMQEDRVVGGNSFDSEKYVTLQATANEGYKFLYFLDNDTGAIFGQGVEKYTYNTLLTKPLSITAVFTGKDVVVNLDTKEIQLYHQLVSVKVNNVNVDYSRTINAKVGDTIVIEIAKTRGYDIQIEGATFNVSKATNLLYTHTFALEELTVFDSESYMIDIKFTAPREKIKFAFEIDIENAIDENERTKLGYLTIVNNDNQTVNVKLDKTYTYNYGEEFTLRMTAYENYQVSHAYIYTNGTIYNISDRVFNSTLQVNLSLMDMYFDYEIKIFVYYERLVWTDVRSEGFAGEGTKDNPYIISSVEDFALLAFVVNNGVENPYGVPYSECHYVVTKDLNFTGRYFEPIGTKANPFNGTIDLGKHEFKNVSHYMRYKNPDPSYDGLFWHLGKNAKIIQKGNTLVVMIIVIVVSVALLVSIVLIIVFIRKRKKKKLNEIANV